MYILKYSTTKKPVKFLCVLFWLCWINLQYLYSFISQIFALFFLSVFSEMFSLPFNFVHNTFINYHSISMFFPYDFLAHIILWKQYRISLKRIISYFFVTLGCFSSCTICSFYIPLYFALCYFVIIPIYKICGLR